MNLKSPLITLMVITLLASPIWISHLIWRFGPERVLKLLVVDYSVPDDSYWNHKGLFFLLNHLRIIPPSGHGTWQLDSDYVGFDPKGNGRGTRISEVPLDAYDWLYLADTYGVHVRDRSPSDPAAVKNGFIFGGLSIEDATALASFSEKGNIISEFNSLSDPTPVEARHIVADIMGIDWVGWAGRFIVNFAEVPKEYPWFVALYEAQYKKRPLPKGHGMMLISQDGRLVVLHGAVFERSMPTLMLTDLGRKWISQPVGMPPYYGWFGVVTPLAPKEGTEVLAEIVLPTPTGWREVYRQKGVPTRFPLVTRKRNHGRQYIDISANISVVDEVPTHHGLAFLPKLLSTIHRRRDSQEHGPAFWQFFVPVMSKILVDAAVEADNTPKGDPL